MEKAEQVPKVEDEEKQEVDVDKYAMEKAESIRKIAKTVSTKSVALTPQLEGFDLLQYIRRPPGKEFVSDFRIILNLDRFKMCEVSLTFPEDGILELRAKHDKRPDVNNIFFTRDVVYRWTLPADVPKEKLFAHWSEDNFLIIKPIATEVPAPPLGEFALIPCKVHTLLRPELDLGEVKTLVEDIRDKCQHTLKFMRNRIGPFCPMEQETDSSEETDSAEETPVKKEEEASSPSK